MCWKIIRLETENESECSAGTAWLTTELMHNIVAGFLSSQFTPHLKRSYEVDINL